MKAIVVYRSRSGFVKKYAEWIAEELSVDLKEGSKVKVQDLLEYDTIIFGGGLYATGINGVKLITKNYDKLSGNKIIVFMSGASPGREEELAEVRSRNFTEEQLKNIKFFYLRGGFDFSKLKFPFTTIMRLMKWHLKRKKQLSPDDRGMLNAFDTPIDFTKKENIKELVDEAQRK